MFAKLRNLEHKLGNIEIEDLQHLTVESSDSFYAEILDAFLAKFSQSFKIKEVLEEKREFLVLTLIRKLETMTEGQSLLKPKSALRFKGTISYINRYFAINNINELFNTVIVICFAIQCCKTFAIAFEFACENQWT